MAARPAGASREPPCGGSAERVSRSRPAGSRRQPASTASGPRHLLLLALATEPIRHAKAAAEAAQLARSRRVGRDLGVVNRSDYGHGIRLVPIRGPSGVIAQADVVVDDAPDPDMPNITVRRARRTDPLEVLRREGTINARASEAGEKLRDAIERSQSSLPDMFAFRSPRAAAGPRRDLGAATDGLPVCAACRRRTRQSPGPGGAAV